MSSEPSELALELVRRDADACVLAVSGELSLCSAGLLTRAVSKALLDVGRVLVDVSGLRLTRPSAAQLFPTTLMAVGGWPGARLVLFGVSPELARALTAMRGAETVPLASDEAAARRLLGRRPPAVARYLDLNEGEGLSLPRRARLFVKAACADWQLHAMCDDAMLVASELVDNAVTHARTSGCRLNLRLDALGLTVAVRDAGYGGVLAPLAHPFAGGARHPTLPGAPPRRAKGGQPPR